MIVLLYRLSRTDMKNEIIFFNLFLVIQSLQIFFSSSRRGFIIINLIIILLVLNLFISVFYGQYPLKSYVNKYKYFLIIITFLFGGFYLFVIKTSYTFKLRSFDFIGIKRTNILQKDLTEKCYRYFAIFNKKTSYSSFYKKIWAPDFDPKDPDSGWGTRTHKTIFPLTGENVAIVPAGAKGYLMDSTCNPYVADGNSYSYTDLYLYNLKVSESDSVMVSVYCYVSEDFNGDWALIALTNNDSEWIGSAFYDLNRKGIWQKLCFTRSCRKGEISSYLYFCKTGVTDFTTLKGFVIFANPECVIKPAIKSTSSTIEVSLLKNGQKKIDKNLSNLRPIMLKNNVLASYWLFPQLNSNSSSTDKDILRRLVSKVVSQDTVYHGYKTQIVIHTIKDSFLDLRYVRWQFAWQIFNKEYNFRQKLFGGGFNFLNWYGYYFLKDKKKTDYPHNPFLHVLLYSGIFGLILYLILLFKVFYYYIKYLKDYWIVFIFFIITTFFTFFSGGNPFDPPIMGFFVILPFFIHSIYKKDKTESISI
jgi:hypothetical protein